MLVLSRKMGEEIRVGEDIVLTVIAISGNKVRLGITAPGEISVYRGEVFAKIQLEKVAKADSQDGDV